MITAWNSRHAWCVLTLSLLVLPGGKAADFAREVRRETGVEAGLCVVLAFGDGALAADLTNGGRMVVQSLLRDARSVEAAQKTLCEKGLYGLATVDLLTQVKPLPYADNLVNLLVVDSNALGERAPSREEMLRVLSPRGAAYVRAGQKWSRIVKPMPPGMDGWGHFYHGPDGNPVSQDEEVGPPTGLQWIAGVACMGAEPTTGYRLAGGRALYEWEGPRADKKLPPRSYLICRDAFSGVLLWSKRCAVRPHKTRPLILTDDQVYTYLDPGEPLVALDARTGEVVHTYKEGGRADKKLPNNRTDVNLVYHDGFLVQTAGNTAYVLDAKTGELKWKHSEEEGRFVDYPTVGATTGQIFFTTGTTARDAGRYPGADTRFVIAYDLKTGKPSWRREMNRELSQLCFVDDALYAFNLAGFIGRPRDLFLARVNPKDGAIVWQINPGAKGQFLDFSIINGKIYVMSLGLKVYDAGSGKELVALSMPGNSRCEMSRATKNHLLMSFGNFLDLSKEPLEIQRCEISRGSCGTGNTPGYGMLFYNPNRCQCFVSVRGYMAASREKFREPMDDALRLEKGEARVGQPKKPTAWPAPGEWPIYLGNPQRGSSTATPVADNLKELWSSVVEPPAKADAGPVLAGRSQTSHFNGPITAPVIAEGKVFVAVPEAHRVEALEGKTGAKLWHYVTGGRVDTPPTIWNGLCLFGCRDGRAYALDAATGKLRWRFLAAPYERRMVAHDQLESSWPVFGSVTLVEDVLVLAAGRHPETNGGIFAYGLDPEIGKLLWKRSIRHERKPGPLGGKIPDDGLTTRRYGYNANTVLNEILISDGKLVTMTGMILDPRTGEIRNPPWPKKLSDKPQGLPVHPMPFYLDLGFRPPYRDQQLENYDGPGADHGSWTFRLANPKLEVHGESVAFNRERVVAVKVAGIEWGMWDVSKALPEPDGKGRQNSSHAPTWSVPRPPSRGMDVKAIVLAADKLLIGLSSPRGPDGSASGEVRIYSTKDSALLGRVEVKAGIIQSGLAVAHQRLYVSCADGTVRCFAE